MTMDLNAHKLGSKNPVISRGQKLTLLISYYFGVKKRKPMKTHVFSAIQ